MEALRKKLVAVALSWEAAFGNAPQITAALSELDAAMLVGLSLNEYSNAMRTSNITVVQKGHDFIHGDTRYQVKANRPSGKRGAAVTLVPKAKNYDWDVLIWILYNTKYEIQEAWRWEMEAYKSAFDAVKRLSPMHYRSGCKIA